MASLYGVLDALVSLISGVLYPDGTGSASMVTADGIVYQGWPVPQKLTDDVKAGKWHVSVFAPAGLGREVSQYPREWQETSRPTPTITATINGQTITLAGTVTVGNLVAPLIGNVAYPYLVQDGDTLATITAALLALIQVDYPGATSSGHVITLPASANLLLVQTGASGTASMVLRRMNRHAKVTIWAPKPELRQALFEAISQMLASTFRADMADGSTLNLVYAGDTPFDNNEKATIYRHEITMSCTWAMTQSETFAPVLINTLNLMVQQGSIPASNTSVRMGVTYINGSQLAELWIGNTAPSSAGPFLWLQTDKPIIDPTYTVIKENYGP